jgi:hypothetical protein
MVYVNGKQTRYHRYDSQVHRPRLLYREHEYHIEVKAVVVRDGRQLVRTEHESLPEPGEERDVSGSVSTTRCLPPPRRV